MANREIFVTDVDLDKLTNLLAAVGRGDPRDREHIERLEAELERAHIVTPADVPPDVVTMNSEVQVRNLTTGETQVFTLVFPAEANVDLKKVSVLAPIGMAVLGYRVGDVIEWTVPAGTRRLEIERVLYQPEAAGAHSGQ